MNKNFNLYRRNGKNIYIKQPKFDELSFVEELWGDKENMIEVGGTYSFPRTKWEMFYKKMVQPTDGKNFYCLIYTIEDKKIGEVSFHGYNSATKVARVNVKIHHRYRGNGYGEEALRLLLEYYFLEFGGEAIIDTIKTNEAKKLLKKMGFEEISNFRNQLTYKITKKKFLNCKINSKRTIAVLSYDDMDILEYSIPFNIFSKANEILKEDYFQIYSISNKENVASNNIVVNVDKVISNDIEYPNIIIEYPNIIVIPGDKGSCSAIKDSYLRKYILAAYNNCDYIATFSNAIYFLNELNGINGISAPKSIWKIEGMVEIEESFVDNGKLILSSNPIGSIEACLNIVKKLAGQEISNQLSKEIGIF